ncbi:MAG TPA: diguanylate cyclase [Eoetvoesiella sp.]
METKTYTPPASFIDILMDAVFAVDVDANIVFASASCERIFGYTPQEMIGKNMFDMMVPEDRERTRESVGEVMSGNPQLYFENRYIRKDGQVVHIMWSARWSPAEQLRIGVARDITERKRAELMQAALYSISEAAYAAEDLLALFKRIHQIVGTLLPADNFVVTLYDDETDQLSFPYHVDEYEPTPQSSKPAAGTLYAEIIRTRQPLLLTPETIASCQEQLQVSVDKHPLCWLGVPLKSHDSTIGVLVVKSYPGGVCYSEKDQELLQFVSTQIATVIERQQMQVRLQHMAQYDQLTVLPNRGLLYDRLKVALSTARLERGRLSVLYIDLDKFKQVNDTLGHSVGDLLLQEVAKRLKQCVRESDTVARVGGDEFVVLLQRIPLPEQAELVAEKIRNVLSPPYTIDGHSLSIVPSIGIALYPEHGDGEQQLLKHADKAMYFAKNSNYRWTISIEPNGRDDSTHMEAAA